MTHVKDLKRGTRFRILRKIYVLHGCSPCSATVSEDSEAKVAKFTTKGGQEVEFVQPSRRVQIAPSAEVDEVLGTVELPAEKDYTAARRKIERESEAMEKGEAA